MVWIQRSSTNSGHLLHSYWKSPIYSWFTHLKNGDGRPVRYVGTTTEATQTPRPLDAKKTARWPTSEDFNMATSWSICGQGGLTYPLVKRNWKSHKVLLGESINQWFSIAMFDRRVILLWSGDLIIKMGTQPVKIWTWPTENWIIRKLWVQI